VTTTGDLILGTTPATSGDLRVNHGFSANGRDNGNTTNVSLIRWGTTTNTLILGSSNAGYNTSLFGDAIAISGVGNTVTSVNGTPVLTVSSSSVSSAQPISVGTNPSTSGTYNLPNNGTIRMRNNANSADILVLNVNTSDVITLGNSAAAAVLLSGANVLLRPNGTDRLALSDTIAEFRLATIQIDTAVTSPVFLQEDNTTNGATAQNLVIQAQKATGTTSTGGDLRLQSGTGTTTAGAVRLYAGSVNNFTVFPNSCDVNCSSLVFSSGVATPQLGQNTDSSATVTGDTLTIHAQDCSGTTAVTAGALIVSAGSATGGSGTRNGGACTVSSGTGATADGDLTLKRGSTTVFSATSTATALGNSTILVEGASLSGRKVVALARGSAISATQMPSNSGDGVVYIAACTTAPTANPVSGQVVFTDASGTWIRGSSGTVTQVAPP
jgi:hypothetical protein